MSDNSTAHIKFFRESVKRFSKEEALYYLEEAYISVFNRNGANLATLLQKLRKNSNFQKKESVHTNSKLLVYCR